MPGMSSGLQTNNPTIVSAFKSLLLHEGLIILLILALLAVAWNLLRGLQLRRAAAGRGSVEPWPYPEPIARRVLRIAFGIIWILDGTLQAQPSMPLGMTTQVIEPTAATSPAWVQHLVNAGATIWSNHPITAPASAVWIQVGTRRLAARVAARELVSSSWPRERILGARRLDLWREFRGHLCPWPDLGFWIPGRSPFLQLRRSAHRPPRPVLGEPRLGRVILSVMGLFFVGMAVLQAWPGRGFWQGHLHPSSSPGTLTGMVHQMAQTPSRACSRRGSPALGPSIPRTAGR